MVFISLTWLTNTQCRQPSCKVALSFLLFVFLLSISNFSALNSGETVKQARDLQYSGSLGEQKDQISNKSI